MAATGSAFFRSPTALPPGFESPRRPALRMRAARLGSGGRSALRRSGRRSVCLRFDSRGGFSPVLRRAARPFMRRSPFCFFRSFRFPFRSCSCSPRVSARRMRSRPLRPVRLFWGRGATPVSLPNPGAARGRLSPPRLGARVALPLGRSPGPWSRAVRLARLGISPRGKRRAEISGKAGRRGTACDAPPKKKTTV